MTERKYPFVVGNNSTEAGIEQAVEGLRRTVELGKKAQEALDGLERDGHWDETVIWVMTSSGLMRGKFPTHRPVSRADLPDLGSLAFVLGKGEKDSCGGHSGTSYPLTIQGTGVVDVQGELRPRQIDCLNPVAFLRVSARVISYVVGPSDSAYPVTVKLKGFDSMLARISRNESTIVKVAVNVSRHLVVAGNQKGSANELTQSGVDLFKLAREWMVQEGHALRMLEGAVKALCVMGIMDD